MRKNVAGELSSPQKAAVILAVLGPETAAEVLKHLTEEQVEALSLEMVRLDKITPEIRSTVVKEFHDMAKAQDFIAEGGLENAKKVLETAFGAEQADLMMRRIVNAMQIVPFEFLKSPRPAQSLRPALVWRCGTRP